MPHDEHVLVIPEQQLLRVPSFLGFRRVTPGERGIVLDPSSYEFRPRQQVETDPQFKQVIPYVVLRHGSKLFHYRRGTRGTEKRLQSLRSIGIGGHISIDDAHGGDPYRAGMLRELLEEVSITSEWSESFLGLIYDDRTPVGRVHLGVVHLLDLAQPLVTAREAAIAESGFAELTDLIHQQEQFESWSQFVLEEMHQLAQG